MKTIRFLVFRVFLLIALITTYLYLLYGQEREHGVPIVRNAAWNDLVRVMDPSVDDSPRETLGKEIVLIQKFLREHQSEVSVGIYDVTVFKAIEQAPGPACKRPTRTWKRSGTSCPSRNTKQRAGGDPWNEKQSSIAANADSPLSLVKTLSASKFLATKPTSSFTADFLSETAGKGAVSRASNRVLRLIFWGF